MTAASIKYSIIIPTFNRAPSIRNILTSLLNQTYKHFEVVICDDGSIDNTAEVVKEFSDRLCLKYVFLQNSGGPAAPRNKGIDVARGTYCAFLDSDDLWYSNKLSVVDQFIAQGYDWVYHDLDICSNNQITGLFKVRDFDKHNPVFDMLYNFNPIATSGIVIKTQILKITGKFNERKEFHFVEDFDYWLRLVQINTNCKAINTILGTYSEHEFNNSRSLEQAKKIDLLYKSFNENTNSTKIQLANFYAQFSVAYNAKNVALCKKICASIWKTGILNTFCIKSTIKCFKLIFSTQDGK